MRTAPQIERKHVKAEADDELEAMTKAEMDDKAGRRPALSPVPAAAEEGP